MVKLKLPSLLLMLSLCSTAAYAYDFESGGIYYDILSSTDKTVAVTYKDTKYNSYKGQVEIPATVSDGGVSYTVTEIGKYAFQKSTDLMAVIMHNTVSTVGEKAFYNSGIISVTVGSGVTSIGSSAFYGCRSLYKVIMLPNATPSGISSAFESLSDRVTYVPNSYYSDSRLGQIKEYKYLSALFSVDGVKYVTVSPSDLTCDVIDYDYGSTAAALTIADKFVSQGIERRVVDIQPWSFYKAPCLAQINISVEGKIGNGAFMACPELQTVKMSSGISTIGKSCFEGCSKIKTVTLPLL